MLTLNDAVKGKSMSGDYHMSEVNGYTQSLTNFPSLLEKSDSLNLAIIITLKVGWCRKLVLC